MKTLIIIPAYNEGENIAAVCTGLRDICPWADMVVVNDASHDNTADVCRENGFPLLDLPVNLGLSGAVGAGMRYAQLKGYEAALQFDGDGQHRPEYVLPLVRMLKDGADIACGSRFFSQSKPISLRMLGSRLISFAIRLSTGAKLTDPTSGLRAYSALMIRQYAQQINHPPEPDTLSYLIKRGAVVREMQVTMDERKAGTSYLTAFSALRYMLKMAVSILLVQPFRGGKKLHDNAYEKGVSA